jgi:hypothetical protein
MNRSIVPGLAVVIVAALVGCGSGSESHATPAPSKTSPAPAPTTKSAKQSTAADRQLASGALLRLSDLPSGWTASDDSDESSDTPCEQIKTAKAQTSARSNAPDFGKGDNTQVSHTVYVYADEGAAGRNFVALTSQALRVCVGHQLGDAMKKGIGGEATVGKVATSQLGIDPVGEESAAAHITFPLSTQGVDVDINLDLVIVRQGRAISLLLLIDSFTEFDDDLRSQLTSTTAERLQTALAS